MKRSAIVLAVMLVMAFIPSTASAGRPDKPDKPNGPPYYALTTCSEVDPVWGYRGTPDDGLLQLEGHGDCNDVSGLETGSIFEFAFAATGSSAEADSGKDRGKNRHSVRLGVRNSLGGEWCDGLWEVDGDGVGRFENFIVDPAAVDIVTLEIDEELQGGNCADWKGDVRIFDADPGHVVTAWRTGKDLDGSMTITLTGPTN